ncbi:GNAT family N-acetyltransferase [Halorhabdus rudnickae]|uniref:GNAT family N-acetyltransferase n=1 Tax=Halorhabdus rudnickae TaxID=1775544 RepID=UPI0010848E8E|nr:N-acetyltransferase [Halorhabdus rudnickae]
MSVTVEATQVERGDDEHVDAAWDLKERIREQEGMLRQRRRFFENAYRRSTVYLYHDRGRQSTLIGFAAVRRDGYMLFLAVAPEYRGEGFGKRLVARVLTDYDGVSCHARTTNRPAMQFYQHVGFEIVRRVDAYYEDGGDAYYLTLGDDEGIIDRLQNLISR